MILDLYQRWSGWKVKELVCSDMRNDLEQSSSWNSGTECRTHTHTHTERVCVCVRSSFAFSSLEAGAPRSGRG